MVSYAASIGYKVARRKKSLTDYEYMTTLKGFDTYTLEGCNYE